MSKSDIADKIRYMLNYYENKYNTLYQKYIRTSNSVYCVQAQTVDKFVEDLEKLLNEID